MVKLSLDPLDDDLDRTVDERILEFRVIDTGKGISSEYLRTSLFNRMHSPPRPLVIDINSFF